MPEAITCCGVMWNCSFCGHCGKKLREPSPLRSLLKHLDRRAATAKKRKAGALAARYAMWGAAVGKALQPQPPDKP